MSGFLQKTFSKDPCNLGRQAELDLGKAIPILCLAFVHCVIECATDEQLLSGIPYLFDSVIGGPMSGPMWLFCMGATIHYARDNSPKALAKRGIHLILIGFLLNICRFFIPYMIGYAVTGDAEQFLVTLPYWVFGNDVLMFAGLAMLCFAFFRKFNFPKWAMFSIALGFSIIGTLVRGTDLGNDVLNIICGWFFGTVNEADCIISDFPLLNWLIIPVCGYIFGWVLQRVKDKNRFYLLVSPIMLVIAGVYLYFGISNEIGMFGEGQNAYYHMFIYDSFVCMSMTLGLLGVYHFISLILPKPIKKFVNYTSSNITEFYCIHWVFVRSITNVVLYAINGTQVFPIPWTLLIALGIVFATYFCLFVFGKMKARYAARKGKAEA